MDYRLLVTFSLFAAASCANDISGGVAHGSCAEKGISVSRNASGQTVHFDRFFPIKMRTSNSCDINGSCSYDLVSYLDTDLGSEFKNIQITNLCASTTASSNPFEKTRPHCNDAGICTVEEEAEYDYSSSSYVTIKGSDFEIDLSWGDFALAPTKVNWGSLTRGVESSSTTFYQDVATTTYSISVNKIN